MVSADVSGAALKAASIPMPIAADAKSIAMKSSPLPRNTVEKNLSSSSPSLSRMTPMNQRQASIYAASFPSRPP